MTIHEAIEARHSVRAYLEQPLTGEIVKLLDCLAVSVYVGDYIVRIFQSQDRKTMR